MAPTEIKSFIAKFRYLCSAGFQATLKFSCDEGITSVSMDCNLGFLPPPVCVPPPASVKQNRSPGYYRRLKRHSDAMKYLNITNSLLTPSTVAEMPLNTVKDVTEEIMNECVLTTESRGVNMSSTEEVDEVCETRRGEVIEQMNMCKNKPNEEVEKKEDSSLQVLADHKVNDAAQLKLDKTTDGFYCEFCQFCTSRETNFTDHMSRKHGMTLAAS